MQTNGCNIVKGIFGNSLSNTLYTRDFALSTGKQAREEVRKSKIFVAKRDPNSAMHTLEKGCFFLEKMATSLEVITGVALEKSVAQSNSVQDRIETASDWINTENEGDTYDVLDKCADALSKAVEALINFAESVSDEVDVNKSKYSKLTEKEIYKAWQHKDGSWWDNPTGNQVVPVEGAGGTPAEGVSSSSAPQERKKDTGGDKKAKKEGGERKKPEDKQEAPKQYPNKITLSKEELNNTLSNGFYSVISAGRNPNNSDEAGLDPNDPKFKARHEELRGDLEKLGYKYTEVVGHYGGEEPSFLIFHEEPDAFQNTDSTQIAYFIQHDESKTQPHLNALGKKYNQDSVLHGAKGRNELHFTSGKNEGKKCGGNGHQELPDADDYFTAVPVQGKNHSKVQMDISECFKPGGLLSGD